MNSLNYLWLVLAGTAICGGGFAQMGDMPGRIDRRSFDPSTMLWYEKPAGRWEDALPVGNGRIGAMVFGGAAEEHIQLNESTYWTGGPYSTVVEGGYHKLPEIRRLVFEGHYLEAQKLFGRALMGYPVEQQKYQSLADLLLHFDEGPLPVAEYKRWLDLEKGITGMAYTRGGVHYRRDLFISAADNVLVMRIYADRAGVISLRVELRGVRNQTHSNYATDY